MSLWWRAYNEALHDPKLQLISDALFRAWFNVMCIASSNDGKLPALAEIAFALRVKPEKAAATLAQLHRVGLLDKTETGFEPHNWRGRQYKSDVTDNTNAVRQKRYRDRHRNDDSNVTRNVTDATVTHVTAKRPETETEQKQSRADARDVTVDGDLRRAIVKAFEDANSPNLPDTSRVGLWLTQGYDPAIILAVVTDIVRKKPSLQSLNYFDNAIKEAHAVKAPKRIEVEPSQKLSPEDALKLFTRTGVWSRHAPCPEPGHTGCTIPPELFEKYGLLPDGRKMATN